jgi:hypothetical protein
MNHNVGTQDLTPEWRKLTVANRPEHELVNGFRRLASVMSAQIVVAAVMAAGLAAGCAGEQTTADDSIATSSATTTAPAATAPDGTKTAVDEAERVRFHIRGTELRVELLPGARLEDIEDLDGVAAVWAFYCQPRDFSEPSAHATLPFGAAEEFVVELSHDVSDEVAYCYMEAGGAAAAAVGWFLPEEEVFPGEVVTEDPEENGRRAREVTDCARLADQASIETSWPGPGQSLAPGVRPTVDIVGYWLGPTVDGAQAVVAQAHVETDWIDGRRPVPLAYYSISYTAPDDGCLVAMPNLGEAEVSPEPSRHFYVLSMPAAAPTARLNLNEPDSLARAKSYTTRLRNGEEVTVFPDSPMGFVVLTATTFIQVRAEQGRRPPSDVLVENLRPVE